MLEDEQMRLEAIRAALIEGETSGSSAAFDMDAFIRQKRNAEQKNDDKSRRPKKRSPAE